MTVPDTAQFCPRCRSGRFTPYSTDMAPSVEQLERAPFPALSRLLDVYICSLCGEDETMRDFRGLAPIPPDEWPIEQGGTWLNQWVLPDPKEE